MDNNFLAILKASLDTTKVISDYNKIKQTFQKDPAKIKTVMDMSATKTEISKFIKEYSPKFQSMFASKGVQVELKEVQLALKSVFTESEKAAKATNVQQQKLLDSMAKGREQSELQTKAEKERQALAQNNAINKSLEQEYVQQQKLLEKTNQIKLAMSTGSVDSSVSNATTQYQKLTNVTSVLENDFRELKTLQTALGNSATDEVLISNYSKFNSTLSSVNNQMRILNNQQTMASTDSIFALNKAKLSNQMSTYLKSNTKLSADLKTKLQAVQKELATVDKAGLGQLESQFATVKSEATMLGQTGKTIFQQFKSDVGNFLTFFTAGGAVMMAINMVKSGVGTVSELDSALTNINYTMNVTSSQLETVGKDSIQMAEDLNTSAENVLGAVKLYANAKETAQSIIEKAQPAVMLGNVTGMTGEESAKTLQSVMNQFDMTQDDLMEISDAIEAVSQNMAYDFSSGVQGISSAISESGSVAKDAGLSLKEYSSMVGLVIEQTGQTFAHYVQKCA